MLEQVAITASDMLYILFGVVGLCGTVYAIWRGAHQDQREDASRSEDDAVRIMRMDENIKQITTGISDIKAEMRSTKKLLDDHERRIIQLELENKTQWQRIDEVKEAVR